MQRRDDAPLHGNVANEIARRPIDSVADRPRDPPDRRKRERAPDEARDPPPRSSAAAELTRRHPGPSRRYFQSFGSATAQPRCHE